MSEFLFLSLRLVSVHYSTPQTGSSVSKYLFCLSMGVIISLFSLVSIF